MNRNTWILAGVLALLIIIVYLVMQRPGEQSSSGSLGQVLVEYDSVAVDRIEIVSHGATITLEKKAGVWMLSDPLRYRADDAAVANALSSGRKIELKDVVSSNAQKRSVFQVDSSGTLVRIFEHGAVKTSFWIGKPSTSYTETYVRREGSDDVYLATGIFSSVFSRRTNEWRDKTILHTDEQSIAEVTLRFGDTALALVRRDSLWMLGADTAKPEPVKRLLSALANFQTDEFVDTPVAQMPKLTVQIELAGVQLRLFWKKEGDRYYVQSSASPQLFEIYSWRAAQIIKRKKDLIS
ncbi:MAG TPA: DUF4340 domain-containing protein [Bacteroidota bacterium]|nr:DUF4340 domain-containing protein [Bacteroidota bacterium]